MEAQSLVAKDNMMGGMVKGKSDPYAKISVGDVTFKSSVIKENLSPVWNEMYEVCRERCTIGIPLSMSLNGDNSDKHLIFVNSLVCVPTGGAEASVRAGSASRGV